MNPTVLSLVVLFTLSHALSAQELTPEQIVRNANDVLNQAGVSAKAKLVITTTSGKKRELYYDSWSKNGGEKNLIRYTAPRRIKGQAVLMLNNADDIWSFDPRTDRVRKLATHAKKQKMQGSDFSYEDLGSGDTFVTDYSHRRLADDKINGRDCYVIEFTLKKEKDTNYSRLIAWIDRENFFMWQIDYYDRKNPGLLIKTLKQSDMQYVEDIPTGMKITMMNRLDNTATVMEILDITYSVELDDALFTERELKK